MQPNTNYATFWERAFATLLDSIIWSVDVCLVVFLLCTVFATTGPTFITAASWLGLYLVIVHGIFKLIVQPYLISTFGGSLGKMVFGQEVVHSDGKYVTYNRAFFREYIAKMASNVVLGLGYYWIYRNPEKQAWHDTCSDTYVIKKEGKSPAMGYVAIVGLLFVEAVLIVVAMMSINGKERLANDFSKYFYNSPLPSPTISKPSSTTYPITPSPTKTIQRTPLY